MAPVDLSQMIPTERMRFLQDCVDKLKSLPEPTDPLVDRMTPAQFLLHLSQSGQITISEYIELISKL